MQSVDYVHPWWVLRACGRNPLVRGVDRLELVIVALGILVALVAAAGAGALGTAVHDARSRVYVAQAQTWHAVTARATGDSTEHAGSLEWDHAAKTGDQMKIWVDRDGNRVDAPTPTSRAGVEAVGVAYAAWQTVALAVAGLIWWARSSLDRLRDSGWEHDIRCLVDDDEGGRAVNHDRRR
jgi:hypothetical protein